MSWNLFDKTSHDEEEVEQALHAAKHQKHAEFGPQPSNGCCILLYRCVAHHCDRARLCCGECLEHLIPRKWCGAKCGEFLASCCPDTHEICCGVERPGHKNPLDPRSLEARRRGLCWAVAVMVAAACLFVPMFAFGATLVHASGEVEGTFEELGRVCRVVAMTSEKDVDRFLKSKITVREYDVTLATTDAEGPPETYDSGPVRGAALGLDTLRNCWRPKDGEDRDDLPSAYADEYCGDKACVVLRDPVRKAHALYSRGVSTIVGATAIFAVAGVLTWLSLWYSAHAARVAVRTDFDTLFKGDADAAAEKQGQKTFMEKNLGGATEAKVETDQPKTFSDDLDDVEDPPSIPGGFNGDRAPGANTMEVVVPDEAAPGATVEYPTPAGGTTYVTIPEGAAPGAVISVRY